MSTELQISRPGGADLALLMLTAMIWASAFAAIKVSVVEVGPVNGCGRAEREWTSGNQLILQRGVQKSEVSSRGEFCLVGLEKVLHGHLVEGNVVDVTDGLGGLILAPSLPLVFTFSDQTFVRPNQVL